MKKLKFNQSEILVESLSKKSVLKNTFYGAIIASSGLLFGSCISDPVSCSDADVSRYDTGAYADPTDWGNQGDAAGSGIRCQDSD